MFLCKYVFVSLNIWRNFVFLSVLYFVVNFVLVEFVFYFLEDMWVMGVILCLGFFKNCS